MTDESKQSPHELDESQASQIEVSPLMVSVLHEAGIEDINSPDDLIKVREVMLESIERRPYDEDAIEKEKAIRWKRTASQILDDGYTYQKKDCTDIVVLYLALCKGAGVSETRFVKVKNPDTGMVHSVIEIKLPDGWYIFDVSNQNAVPVKGEIVEGEPFGSFLLWKKGRDSWDLDLTEFDSIVQIQV